jgi:molecular chaperone DnaK (HSP70)
VQQVADQLNLDVEQVESLRRKKVATVVPRAFGLKVVDQTDPLFKIDPSRARSFVSHLLTANTPLPADTGPQCFVTVAENQRTVQLEAWEQAGAVASEKLEHNTHIGEGRLEQLPPGPAGTPFQVVFHMTETGLLQVHAWEESSKREVRFEIQIGGLGETEVQQATAAVARYEVNG